MVFRLHPKVPGTLDMNNPELRLARKHLRDTGTERGYHPITIFLSLVKARAPDTWPVR